VPFVQLTRRRIAALVGLVGCLVLILWSALHLRAEEIQRYPRILLRWEGSSGAMVPGRGWQRTRDGLRAGPKGAELFIQFDRPPGAPVYATLEGKEIAGFLGAAEGGSRLVRPGWPRGRAVALTEGPPGPGQLLVIGEPGGLLAALQAGVVQGAAPLPPLQWLALVIWVAACLVLLIERKEGKLRVRTEDLWTAGIALAAVASFALAWRRYAVVRFDEPELPDFHQAAREMSHPLDTGWREPLWPWMLRAWWLLAPPTSESVYLLGVLVAPLAVPASVFLIRRLHASPAVTLLGAWIVGTHHLLAYTAPRGLRAPLYLPLMALAAALAAGTGRRWRWPALGAVGGLLCLLRIEAIAAVALALPVAWWRGRPRWGWLLAGAACFLALLGPVLLWHGIVHGDPFTTLSHHARGHTTRLQLAGQIEGEVDPLTPSIFEGEEVGPVELFVTKIGPLRTIGRYLKGVSNLFLDPTSIQLRWLFGSAGVRWLLWILYPLWGAGLILWILRKRRWGILLLFAAMQVVPIQAALVADPRYGAHLVPFWAGAVALAVVVGLRRIPGLRPYLSAPAERAAEEV
jgi:hypothetical protein